MEALEQSVVEIASDAGPLSDARLQRQREFVAQLPEPDLVHCPHKRQNEKCAQRAEPIRLVIRRRNREFQRITLLIPHPAVVGRDDAEPVEARRKVRVVGVARIDRIRSSKAILSPA